MSDKVIINFGKYPFSFRQISVDQFTNKLKDLDEFKHMCQVLFEKLIPCLYECRSMEEARTKYRHCHSIVGDKLEKVHSIVRQLCTINKPKFDSNLFVTQNLDNEIIWQLGLEDIRIIGIRHENVLDVLFIDYNHLIYSNKKYNQTEYTRNDFKVIE